MSLNNETIGMRLSYDINQLIPKAFENVELVAADSSVGYVKEMLCYRHLGFDAPTERVRPLVESRIEWVKRYFEKGDTSDVVGGWFNPLSRGMLLCMLTNHDSELRSICSWANPTAKAEYKGPLPSEVQMAILVLASRFQDNPDTGFETIASKLAICKKRQLRPLLDSLAAVVESDQQKFALSIQKCVEAHKRKAKPAPDAYFMEDWLPIHANTVFLAGLRLGLRDPNYPDDVSAYLMTPQSVGLD